MFRSRSGLETIQNSTWNREHKKGLHGRWRAQRADGDRGRAGDESFARLVAPMAEEAQTAVDATMEALCQQHDIDVQAYKARIDHLEIMLTSLGIREPLELLPSIGGASTS